MINNTPHPTWRHGNHQSINDYILSKGIAVSEYQVLVDDSYSGHSFLAFEAGFNTPQRNPIYWMDPVKLSAAVRNQVIATPTLHTHKEVDGFIGNLTSTLQGCIDMASEQINVRHTKLPW